MARVDLPVSRISRTAVFTLNAPVADPTNDLQMVNNGATLVLIDNVGGSAHNAQAVISQTVDAEVVDEVDYVIPANSSVVLGPYPRDIYSDLLLINTDHVDLEVRAFSLL